MSNFNEYRRDEQNGIFAGVLAGFANYTGWDLFVLRLLAVIFAVCTTIFPFVIAYLVLWMVIPADSAPTTKETAKKTSKKSSTKKSSTKATAAKQAETVQADANSVSHLTPGARAVLCILGIIGFCVFIPALIALIPATVLVLIVIFSTTIPAKALFVATAILSIILAVNIIAVGLAISGALVAGKFKKGFGLSIIVNLIVALLIFTAACITGGIWCAQVGTDGINDTLNNITEEYDFEINEDGSHLEIHRGGKRKINVEVNES